MRIRQEIHKTNKYRGANLMSKRLVIGIVTTIMVLAVFAFVAQEQAAAYPNLGDDYNNSCGASCHKPKAATTTTSSGAASAKIVSTPVTLSAFGKSAKVSAITVGEDLYIGLRDAANLFGAQLAWDGKNFVATMTYKGKATKYAMSAPDVKNYRNRLMVKMDALFSGFGVQGNYDKAAKSVSVAGGLPGFVGSEKCGACHKNIYASWKTTDHSTMLQPMGPDTYIQADFRTLDTTEFTKEDLLYAVAQGKRFLAMKDGQLQYVPKQFDPEKKVWVDSSWRPYTCAKCHTVGFDKETGTWAAEGVGCESCHGPGAEHAKAPSKANIKSSYGTEMCSDCHGADRQTGQMEEQKKEGGEGQGHLGIFAAASVAEADRYWGAKCYRCHSAAYLVPALKGETPPTAEELEAIPVEERDGITCVVCHDPHKQTGHEYQLRKNTYETCIQCHVNSGGDLTPGKGPHHPQKNLMEGQNLVDGKLLTDLPASGHLDCVACHMTNGNHIFKVGTPEITLEVHGKPVTFNSCESCHYTITSEGKKVPTMTAEKFEAIQHEFEERLEAIEAAWADIEAKVEEMGDSVPADAKVIFDDDVANLHLLSAEGSKGIHNPALAEKLLAKLEADVVTLKAALGL